MGHINIENLLYKTCVSKLNGATTDNSIFFLPNFCFDPDVSLDKDAR